MSKLVWPRRLDFGFEIEDTVILERDVSDYRISLVQSGDVGRVVEGQFEFVLLVCAGQRIRLEAEAVHLQAVDLIQPRAFEHAVGIARMDAETVETGFRCELNRKKSKFERGLFCNS
jgi:hypothetical protein